MDDVVTRTKDAPGPDLWAIGEDLLDQLARPGEPAPDTLAAARDLFTTAGAPALSRWLQCELSGYGGSGAVSLRGALGVADDAPLAARVRGYRQQVGRVRTQGGTDPGKRLQLPYFFGEPLATLRQFRANAEAVIGESVEVESLPPSQLYAPPGAPVWTLEFPRYVFDRVLSGLAVEVELAVRAWLRRPVTPG